MTKRIYLIGVRYMVDCSKCGLCRAVCPVYLAVLKESSSPRGKAIFKENGKLSDLFYMCTLCGMCKKNCPIEVDLEIRKQRTQLIEAGKETEANKAMIENIRKYGNPFGKIEKGKKLKTLFCC